MGEGPEKDIAQITEDLKISKNVIFHGHIDSYEDLIPLYRRVMQAFHMDKLV